MTDIRDLVRAQFAAAAFEDAPGPLPGGFTPLTAAAMGVVIDQPGESFANGVYRFDNAAALVGSGVLGGQTTLVLAFRGADDRQDSINVLRDPGVDYAKLAELVTAVDRLAASGNYQQVVIEGHSLGGSLTQIFMANHPAEATPIRYVGTTFGSPGALVPDTSDPRITNYAVVDDPAIFLGENREAVGNTLNSSPLLARPVADLASKIFPGLTADDALQAIPSLTTNYENAGSTVNLPGKAGGTGPISSVAGLLQADPAQHDISLYVKEIGAIALRPTGSGNEPLFDPAFYLRHNPDIAAAGINPQLHYDTYGWREGRDPNAAFDLDFYLRTNPDVAAANINPLLHYETNGWREGRDPNAFFDDQAYLASSPDVAAAGINPLLHYLTYGWSEGRNPGPAFNTMAYLRENADVAAAGLNPLLHYLEYGIQEGRVIA